MRPILMAAWHGHTDAVQMLINYGASVNTINKVRTLIFITKYFIVQAFLINIAYMFTACLLFFINMYKIDYFF